MSKATLAEGIRQGVFPFAHNLDGTCVIMRKDFEDWAADYLIPYVEAKCDGVQLVKEHEK